jgi:UDP-2,4-diacetamido-2,4,6-trideoxy-beta-L-altropyranose hydrolase
VKVAFRADASLAIGSGHILRCLTLADSLRLRGIQSVFLCRDHVGHLHHVVQERGYSILSLGGANTTSQANTPYVQWLGVDSQRDADDTRIRLAGLSVDWLVVDHYGIDATWEHSLKASCGRIIALDDLANRNHSVDALLDQNLGKTVADYASLVPSTCKMLLGPNFALLRPEFATLRTKSLARREQGELRRILITMGGVDLQNATSEVLEALKLWAPSVNLKVTVVMGHSAPWRDLVIQKAGNMPYPTEVMLNVQRMGDLMCDADLAIGAAGSTAWERCCLGLPTLQLVLAENQRPISDALNNAGAAIFIDRTNLSINLGAMMEQLMQDPARLVSMSKSASMLVDGLGSQRVARYLQEGLEV